MPELEEIKTQIASPEAPVMVRVEGVGKKFGWRVVLKDVQFRIRKGEILGLLGPNGAGKTTTMRILAGFFSPTQGKVWIGEKDLSKELHVAKRMIGYLPENMGFYRDMKVSEFLRFVTHLKGIPRKKSRQHLEEKLARCGLWEIRNRLIGHLSKGFRQRVGLAQALIGDPEILLLDEPTSGLDPKQIMEIRQFIRELGREHTIVLSTHILPEVSMICDRVLMLNEGTVAASGTIDELESGLEARGQIHVIFGDRHRKEEAITVLKSIPEVRRVATLEERGDRIHLSLSVDRDRELRPEISRLFVEQKIPLLELRTERLSLEEIFLKLVVQEPSGKVNP